MQGECEGEFGGGIVGEIGWDGRSVVGWGVVFVYSGVFGWRVERVFGGGGGGGVFESGEWEIIFNR